MSAAGLTTGKVVIEGVSRVLPRSSGPTSSSHGGPSGARDYAALSILLSPWPGCPPRSVPDLARRDRRFRHHARWIRRVGERPRARSAGTARARLLRPADAAARR